MLTGKILITGGAGTLGRAIIQRAVREQWDCQIAIFSTDAIKHIAVRSVFPQVQSVIGDIRDAATLYNAMAGKDMVIHAGAVKHIPVSEEHSIDTYEINVGGSLNVAQAAIQLGIPRVIAISTDKACHPANAYGASKYLMEKVWQEYARLRLPTQFNLVRYGNVLESTGSVVELWRKAAREGKPLKITNPEMTRFWLSPAQAVDLVIGALELESGHIYVAKMPALSIGKLAEYAVGKDYPFETVPLRAGEKMHETLLTVEETDFATDYGAYFDVRMTTERRGSYIHSAGVVHANLSSYSSDKPFHELTAAELDGMLKDG